jgi:Flp pilus assembly protein TadG
MSIGTDLQSPRPGEPLTFAEQCSAGPLLHRSFGKSCRARFRQNQNSIATSMPIRFRRQRGQSLLETAIMLVVIFTVMLWTFEIGWVMYVYSVLADSANEGVRYAIVQSGGNPSGTQATVQKFAATSIVNSSVVKTTVSFPDGSATPPNRVRVQVSYPYVPFLSTLLPNFSMKTFAEGRMVIQ